MAVDSFQALDRAICSLDAYSGSPRQPISERQKGPLSNVSMYLYKWLTNVRFCLEIYGGPNGRKANVQIWF